MIGAIYKYNGEVRLDWYKPEYMGTVADWFGIIATGLAIFLTVRYYANDNKREFRIVFYPIYHLEENSRRTYYNNPRSFEFYVVNFSKQTDAVYFYTIKSKANLFSRKCLGIPILHLNWDFSIGPRKPNYQNIEPKHNTRIEFFEVHWFIDHALEVYEKSKRKCLIKKIKLEIVYVNVEGKKFSKILPFEVEGLLSYKQSEMNK